MPVKIAMLFWSIACCFLALPGLRALTPEEAAAEALERNPELLSTRWIIAEAEGRLIQAGLWDNPVFEAGLESGRSFSDRMYRYGLSQNFPLAGRLAKAKGVARVDVAMAVEEYRDARRRLAGEVLGMARRLLLLERRAQLVEENRKLLAAIREKVIPQVAAGTAATSDAVLIELEEAQLTLEEERLAVEKEALQAQLRGKLGRPDDAPLKISGNLPATPSHAVLRREGESALTRRPDRQLALLSVDRAQAEQRLARSQRWDGVMVGVEAVQEAEHGYSGVGVRVSIPLPLWDRQRGRLAETAAARQRAQAGVAARDLAIRTEIDEAGERIEGGAALVKRSRGAMLELARRNTHRVAEAYGHGRASFVSIFESQKQQLALERLALENEERLVEAVTAWETATVSFPPVVRKRLE
ncbi:MAG TPA: TolC family protein [Chthoniobacteraceae bacterium]|nr:TolC family protein [Chthoniobacteraceae bacterium]